MQVDSRTVAPDAVIQADVCIIGAGPAGITLARQFIGTQLRVLVLESGGFDDDENVQDLSAGSVSSQYMRDSALTIGRQRQFGGTPNMWIYKTDPWNGRLCARCVSPEARDFTTHNDDPALRWPVSFDELHPHFRRAQKVWNDGVFDYRVDTWGRGHREIGTADGILETRVSQHGPSDVFTVYYRDELLSAENIALYLGCTAAALESGASADRVRNLSVARNDGQRFWVQADTYVLACGGVENVQLLLSSDVARPGAGWKSTRQRRPLRNGPPRVRHGIHVPAGSGCLPQPWPVRHPMGRWSHGERIPDALGRSQRFRETAQYERCALTSWPRLRDRRA